MSKIDRLAYGEIGVDTIFGLRADPEHERKLLHDLSKLEGRTKKAGDFAINMFMRLFDPQSEHATKQEHVGRPVILTLPSSKHTESKGQIDAFSTVAKAMFSGRGLINELHLPYTEDITLVGHNEFAERMVIGQKIHSHFRPEKTIPGIDEEIQRINELNAESPDATPYIPTKASLFYIVLAHADKNGVNSDLYDEALERHQRMLIERNEVMDFEITSAPLDFSVKIRRDPS